MFFIICPLLFLAGFVDSIAGGGGLISLPAYMLTGMPMHQVLATNKLPYMYMGVAGAGVEFWIVDDPKPYQEPALEPYRRSLYVAAAWTKSGDPESLDMLSAVTGFWIPAGSFGDDE